jgi:diaminopimelate decarboxylase
MNDPFLPPFLERREGVLTLEDCSLEALAERYGTPLYVYSGAALDQAYGEFSSAFSTRDTLICYAVKANGNLSLLSRLAQLGAGFDIVSGGELQRVLAAGGNPAKILFSGVGKSAAEIRLALEAGILSFNVESAAELERINQVAHSLGLRAPVSLRVNPDVNPDTHPYIATGLKNSKFGIAWDEALPLYQHAAQLPGIHVVGMDCHIGSQILSLDPFVEALERVLGLMEQLNARGIVLEHLDLGGGMGIRYRDESPFALKDYAAAIDARLGHWSGRLILEPGRRLVANSGLLLTRVEYLKPGAERGFAIVDAAMNDLIRPSLYEAWHGIVPVTSHTAAIKQWDIVGPVCESGDILGQDRALSLEPDSLLAILSAGAYGASMGSNYNARTRPAEVLVEGSDARVIRSRETFADLIQQEQSFLSVR